MTTKKKVVKKPVKRVKKALTLRQVLTVVEDVLMKGDDTARNLWCILTALRGPDTNDYVDKSQHTIPIRRAAFPKLAKGEDNGTIGCPADFSKSLYVPPSDSQAYGHFGRHIRYAAEALGLDT